MRSLYLLSLACKVFQCMGAVSCEHAPAHETHRAGLEGTLPLLLLTLPFNMAQGWTFNVQALDMGLINTVVPLDKLQEETTVWCREILRNSPTALRVLKAALNAAVSPHLWQFISCALMFTYHTSEQCKWSFSYFSIALHKYHR